MTWVCVHTVTGKVFRSQKQYWHAARAEAAVKFQCDPQDVTATKVEEPPNDDPKVQS